MEVEGEPCLCTVSQNRCQAARLSAPLQSREIMDQTGGFFSTLARASCGRRASISRRSSASITLAAVTILTLTFPPPSTAAEPLTDYAEMPGTDEIVGWIAEEIRRFHQVLHEW